MKKLMILLLGIFLIGINRVYADTDIVKFSNCVDGDTIKVTLNKKEYTVRMLAVDTPESVHPTKGVEYYGKEASEYTCNMVTNAKKIEIEYDDDSDKTDKYDRLLVWVFTDGSLLQKDLVENGYAKVAYLYGDYKYTNELETIQEKASAKSIGIWNEEAKEKYNKENGIKKEEENNAKKASTSINESGEYTTKDIIIIGVLLLIIIFVGDKTIKNKAKKKLKNYLR